MEGETQQTGQQSSAELFDRMFGTFAKAYGSGRSSSNGGGGNGNTALAAAAMSNPYTAAIYAAMEVAKTGNNSAAFGQFDTSIDHSGWNVNFGSGSITSSATREAASQWINILAGIAALIVAYKTIRG